MAKEMLINVAAGEECRIALLDDGKLEELYMERTSSTSHVGNIYKGRVTNVEPSIQAAFVDFGLGRNGFLHISDLMPTYFGRAGGDIHETVGRKMARRDRPPIQRCLRRGDEIIVQIIKEGIGTKGPTLSTYLSIPGRILVMMPGMGKMGVSKKIEDEEERRRLRQILDGLKPPKDVGFIIRTAGIDRPKTEIQRDLTYLSRLWQTIEKKRDSGPGPMELYTEGDLVTRTVRDVFSSDVDRLVVDNKDVAKRVKEVIKITNPRTKNRVDLYEEPIPLFHKFGIEKDIELMYSRHVPLPSGGSLVIDSTEAIVAIDVNSGKFRDHSDAETTAFKTDMEAADEIPRQLRLRDLGGVIIVDFIDLRYERHRRDLEQRLHDNLKNDRAKTKVLRMSQFGIIEMTRQRMRPSLKRSIYFDCPHCKGAGLVKTPESMSLDVMRRLAIAVSDQRVVRVELSVCPDVSFYLLNKKRAQITEMEERSRKRVVIRTDATLGLDEMRLELFDARDGAVFIEELGMPLTLPHTTQLGTRGSGGPAQRGRGGRTDDRKGRDRNQPRLPAPSPAKQPEPEERFDFEDADEDAEEGEPQPTSIDAEAKEIEPGNEAPLNTSSNTVMGERPAGEFDRLSEGGQRRRRRGRRGGRGRGRGKTPAGAQAAMQSNLPNDEQPREESTTDAEPGDLEPATDQPPDESAPKRRRRRRGGRGRRRGRNENGAPGGESPQPQRAPSNPSVKPVVIATTPSHRAVRDEQPVVKTGSTDRHLVQDEPLAPQPVSRPRTYRDLDAIPDDFD